MHRKLGQVLKSSASPSTCVRDKKPGTCELGWECTQRMAGMLLRRTGTTRKMSQRYFCPADYTTKTKPNPETNPKLRVRVSLGFGLVCTPLGKNIVGSFFWSYPLFCALLLLHVSRSFNTRRQTLCLKQSKTVSNMKLRLPLPR